jgi:LysM repeat protein
MTKSPEATSTEPTICRICGSKLGPNATRCVVCGTPVGSEGGQRFSGGSQVTLSLPLAIGLLAIFTFLAAGLTFAATRLVGSAPGEEPVSTPTDTPTVTATLQASPTDTVAPPPTALPTLEYTVIANDTCIAIAVRYDISIQSILQSNPGLTADCILSVGQKINIPQPTPTASPEPTSTLPPEEATRAACETITYTVEANDTLSGIAQNYNVDVRAILDYNGLNNETVFLGQILIIPLCERLPTPGPSPTATPPPPHPAANLLLPQDGAAFTLANDTITLQWASVGVLRENEFYEVTVVDITEGSGTRRIVGYVSDTKYIVPSSFRPQEELPHIMRWSVRVVRQVGLTEEGEPIYESGGAESLKRVFTWSGAAVEATPAP